MGVDADRAQAGFGGLRVMAFESRLAEQMAQLIERYGGRPTVAPSMREVPLERNTDVLRFGERLMAGEFAMVILLTGVGTRFMLKVLDTRWPREQTLVALGKTVLIVRGPKPLAVLREQGLQPSLAVPEPNPWRDLVRALDELGRSLKGMNVAVQEYGVSNVELLDAIRDRGAIVTRVPVYQWMLPEDTGPLTRAVRAVLRGEADVVLFTNAVQVDHVMQVVEGEGGADGLRRTMSRIVVAAVGPIVAERLRSHGLPVDLEPSHPKMGILVKEAGERAAEILLRKRATPPD
jgi:uroporphyrinogen-III synthase